MSLNPDARGAAPVAILSRMETWEANLILNLRLWCDGPSGQSQVWSEYRQAMPGKQAQRECHAFELLVRTVLSAAYRPLVRHEIGCSCVGADEAIFANLVRFASDGHLSDAALVATLMLGPSQAEHVAVLAGQVGSCARRMHAKHTKFQPETAANVVRLH